MMMLAANKKSLNSKTYNKSNMILLVILECFVTSLVSGLSEKIIVQNIGDDEIWITSILFLSNMHQCLYVLNLAYAVVKLRSLL